MSSKHSPASFPVSVPARRRLLGAVPALGAAWAFAPLAARAQRVPREGDDYKLIQPPQPTENPAKVEVTEFFWYGCIHCWNFLPYLERWYKTLPSDVIVRKVPVAFDPALEPHSRIYYALEALGLETQFHRKVMQAIAVDHQQLRNEADIADFMAKNGIDRKKWLDTYNSFGVVSRAQAARRVVDAYKVDGTPSVAINGRYRTSPADAHGADAALQVADYLIAQSRKAPAR